MRFYAGIGSRDTPIYIVDEMMCLAQELEQQNWWLRSGGAEGADRAFQSGVANQAQIWLPWPNFGNPLYQKYPNHQYWILENGDKDAFDSIQKHHPAPNNLSQGAKKLMARNYRQIIGKDEADSSFVLCWTKDGKDSGGTGQAIRIAEENGIPVFNLHDRSRNMWDILKQINETYN